MAAEVIGIILPAVATNFVVSVLDRANAETDQATRLSLYLSRWCALSRHPVSLISFFVDIRGTQSILHRSDRSSDIAGSSALSSRPSSFANVSTLATRGSTNSVSHVPFFLHILRDVDHQLTLLYPLSSLSARPDTFLRLAFASFLLALKLTSDASYMNSWVVGKYTRWSVKDINLMERELMGALKFDLFISSTEYVLFFSPRSSFLLNESSF